MNLSPQQKAYERKSEAQENQVNVVHKMVLSKAR